MNDLLIDELLADIKQTQNITDEEKLYGDAISKYKKAFGYYPHFIALPDPTIEEILNAVETGIELYQKESSDKSYLL